MDLRIEGLRAGYGGAEILHGIDLEVPAGSVAALVGANGAGKSTLLAAVLGTVPRTAGRVLLGGEPLPAGVRAATSRGIAIVPEGRRVFARRTVRDNLLVGAWGRRDRAGVRADLESTYARFPALERRGGQPAGALSGGEAQMLAIGMALMSRPRVLLLDEPSLGLAPVVVDAVLAEVRALADDGMTVLLVEQVVRKALRVADRGHVLRLGEIVVEGAAADLVDDVAVTQAYLGR
ncbi:ABC transporter ATP-binding protein [Pseudonocardia lutea]|uniref:ABC transporter ATP-binding protein n=1 Tax=Pseudonocardia lutea TaxID=2172015 RepID=UPI0036D2BE81